MGLRKVPDGPLREGFTTGTSATAAAKAALLALIHQQEIKEVQVYLPIDKILTIPIHCCTFKEDRAVCSVIKDAGDDPDVTNKAEIGCKIHLTEDKSIVFTRGEGVGVVTLPGLELKVGEPAINPVPRKMMRDALKKILHDFDMECGVLVEVFVVNGKALAKRTLNERVGIFHGLSILGTTGIVKPYSSSSYIASIEQGIDVAVANKTIELVINSGARSEKYLRKIFMHLPEYAFVHYGNWIGETLRKIKTVPLQKVSLGIMLGKAAKLAEGNLDTHSCVSGWNKIFIKQLAEEAGYDPIHICKIDALNMAGRLVEIFPFKQEEPIYQLLLKNCFNVAKQIVPNITLDMYLISKTGEFISYKEE